MDKKIVNLKQQVFAALNLINEDKNHALHGSLQSVLNGDYGASKLLCTQLSTQVAADNSNNFTAITLNLIGKAVIDDRDSVRRYIHQWRKIKMELANKSDSLAGFFGPATDMSSLFNIQK